jgi:DNA polymerase sigma
MQSISHVCSKFSSSQNVPLISGAFLVAVLPFELEHLFLLLIGGAAYYALQKLQPIVAPRRKESKVESLSPWRAARIARGSQHHSSTPKERRNTSSQSPCNAIPTCLGPLKKTTSVQPVTAPVFNSMDWDAEVEQLIEQLAPSPQCEKTVEQIAALARNMTQQVFPEVEVSSFVSGNIDGSRGAKAFGVAVPEVDIVLSISPQAVMQRMLVRDQSKAPKTVATYDERALQKYVMRLCTERLVSLSCLKFRRSAFSGDQPKVTFLATAAAAPGLTNSSVPFDISVNSPMPFYNAALLTEAGQMDPRAKALILLVRRWAKDRGICHASKGHFSPFIWTLMTIYFLQVGVEGEDPVLPPVKDFALSSELISQSEASNKPKFKKQDDEPTEQNSIGKLFKAFLRFYAHFNWQEEAVAVKAGQRAAPAESLPLHMVRDEHSRSSEIGPSIEDPFNLGRNLGTCLTAVSLRRLKEELTRADDLCNARNVPASLSILLEPWTPAEFEGAVAAS